ncbi:hypothetical protein [Ktedonobacter racemifer]|uniref:DUF2637 domain-containing protein n=1 Tax=Ktedonobacter racemifer DSM 44963 TaxID=485913 RepID=D6TMJ4_KTERA|nr:hypothetical protein [Ktedonobacter racemifer]EFH86994.1 hypothetical protein Krac_8312 [Ktedonobacter racemifer DSM 44963]
MSAQDETPIKTFASLHWYDETIKFVFNFAAKTSELLLAAGVVVSSANFLTDGSIMQDHTPLSVAWAWAQALAIDSSLGIVFVNGFQAARERYKIKAGIYFALTAMLASVAGLLTHFDALAHATGLPVTSQSISGIIPLWMLTGLRAVAVIGFLLVGRLKNVSFSMHQNETHDQQPQKSKPTLVITPELLNELRAILYQTTVSEEQTGIPGTPQLTEVATATDQQQNQLVSLLPAVPPISEEERNKVIDAYLQGIPRREICSHLRWGNAKYTTIVKPVLDAYREQEHQTENVEAQA